MTSHRTIGLSCMLACALVAAPADAPAQGRRSGGPATVGGVTPPADAAAQGRRGGGPVAAQLPSDPLTGPVVTKAPYSGEAVTTITQTLFDGTKIEERTEAKFYRDSAGRIRREQTILGLPAANAGAQAQTVVTIDPTPEDASAYTLDPATRTARSVPRAAGAYQATLAGLISDLNVMVASRDGLTIATPNAGRRVRIETGPAGAGKGTEESLGTRLMEGVSVTGRKTTNIIPRGQIGNDRPIEITDERWESADLKVLVYSRFSDPRTGVVEYRLTNISRLEPASDLFVVPSDYTIVEPGGRGGGGGRGQRGGAPQ